MEQRLREPIPELGHDPAEVLERARRDILNHNTVTDHPRFFSYVPSAGNFVSAMADTLASGFNVFAGHWLAGAGAAQTEQVVIDWLCELCGLPESSGGVFVSGGSMATLAALGTAREVRLGGHRPESTVYASDQTHDSLEKGLRLLGFSRDQLRLIPSDSDQRLRLDALQQMLVEDRSQGRIPFCVVANAGTTNTGAVDSLAEIAKLCADEELWMHVDGAFGAAAILCDVGQKLLVGIERADSITLDPHKWWFQPYEIGGLLVRDRDHLRRMFHAHGDYLTETRGVEEEINFYDYGPQLTRGFRALKLWMSIQVFGIAAFRDAVAAGIRRAEYAESLISEDRQFEVVTPARLGIVTFRPRASLPASEVDRVTRKIVAQMLDDGFAFVTTTELDARPILRLCTIHPETTDADIRQTLARLRNFLDSGGRPA